MVNQISCSIKKMRAFVPTLVVSAFLAFPLAALEVPPLNGPVNDLAKLLTAEQSRQLTNFLLQVDARSEAQIAVLTVPSLEGDDIESFSVRVADSWKIGNRDTDAGVLFLVALQERAIRIEVGYGNEGTLTDAKSGLIIRNVVAPYFQQGRYGDGILAGVQNIAGIILADETLVSNEVSSPDTASAGAAIAGIVFFILYLSIFMTTVGRRKSRRSAYVDPFTAAIVGNSLFGRNSGTSGRSGGSFGGFSSGGFSGGGGRFGGGGASGKW